MRVAMCKHTAKGDVGQSTIKHKHCLPTADESQVIAADRFYSAENGRILRLFCRFGCEKE